MEVMANTIPDAATGPKAPPLQKAFIREMLMGQEVEGYVANCRAIGTFWSCFSNVLCFVSEISPLTRMPMALP